MATINSTGNSRLIYACDWLIFLYPTMMQMLALMGHSFWVCSKLILFYWNKIHKTLKTEDSVVDWIKPMIWSQAWFEFTIRPFTFMTGTGSLNSLAPDCWYVGTTALWSLHVARSLMSFVVRDAAKQRAEAGKISQGWIEDTVSTLNWALVLFREATDFLIKHWKLTEKWIRECDHIYNGMCLRPKKRK